MSDLTQAAVVRWAGKPMLVRGYCPEPTLILESLDGESFGHIAISRCESVDEADAIRLLSGALLQHNAVMRGK